MLKHTLPRFKLFMKFFREGPGPVPELDPYFVGIAAIARLDMFDLPDYKEELVPHFEF